MNPSSGCRAFVKLKPRAVKAKCHYAIWFEAGSKLVADLQRSEIWPIIQLASSELARASRTATSFEPVCDQLRAGSSYVDISRQLETARSWSQTGSKPDSITSSCQFAASKLDARPNFSSLQVCDQLRASFEPDSVMEYGLKRATRWLTEIYLHKNHIILTIM